MVDDALAAIALRAAETIGRRVPSKLAMIGYGDDHFYCYSSYPALSSIAHLARAVGHGAAEQLLRQMRGQQVEGTFSVASGKVMARESSDIIAIDDAAIRDLVGWIRSQSRLDPIRVSDLAERSGLSLTTIKDRFAQLLGHSPKQEIQQARIQYLQMLIATSQQSFSEIAEQMGFSSSHELNRFCKSSLGMSPSEYRSTVLTKNSAQRKGTTASSNSRGDLPTPPLVG